MTDDEKEVLGSFFVRSHDSWSNLGSVRKDNWPSCTNCTLDVSSKNLDPVPLADPGVGATGTYQFLSLLCSFWQQFCQIIGWRPTSGVGAPLQKILDVPLTAVVVVSKVIAVCLFHTKQFFGMISSGQVDPQSSFSQIRRNWK